MSEDRQPLTSAEKKRRYRAKMRNAGFKEIGIWVNPDYADDLRKYADSLPKPSEPENPNQEMLPLGE